MLPPPVAANLLDELCVRLGFCLPPDAKQALIEGAPSTPRAFADAVFLAEGVPLPINRSELYDQVIAVIQRAFECSSVPPDDDGPDSDS